MQQQVEEAVEATPDDRREDAGEDPAFFSLHLQIGEDEERYGEGKAEEHDRREEAEDPRHRDERAPARHLGRLLAGELEVRRRLALARAECRPGRFGGGEKEKRNADDERK